MTTAAAAADVRDSMVFEELIDAIEPIKRSEKLHADKAYEDKKCARALTRTLRSRGASKRRIARKKGVESSEKLGGRHRRWVVERTLAWLPKYRRPTIRYERRDDIHEGFLHLGCSLICFHYLS